jgi:CBS domain-containing protein
MQVAEVLDVPLHYVLTGQTVEHAAKRMIAHRLTLLPVCGSDGRVKGVVTFREIVEAVAQERAPELCEVDDVMRRAFPSCLFDDDATEVYARMISESASDIVVVNAVGKLAGVVGRGALAMMAEPARIAPRRLRKTA